MINFYLPNFYKWDFRILNSYFIEMLQKHPECFYDNIHIGAIYGSFPGVIWNGGRAMIGDASINDIEEVIAHYAQLNTPIRFTYTNSLINESHLCNLYAYLVTNMAQNGMNEILVNSPILEGFLRENFPNYKYISSTTKCLLDENEIISESEKYYLTVLDYRKNPDLEFLKSLPNPEKYEILLNAYCDPNCTNRMEHYRFLSEAQLHGELVDFPCSAHTDCFFDALKFPTVIKLEDLYSTYADMGFRHFKIEGRTNNIIDVLESYLYYMVKPEYKDQFRYEVLKSISFNLWQN